MVGESRFGELDAGIHKDELRLGQMSVEATVKLKSS